MIHNLEQLVGVLDDVAQPGIFDQKLADYVFFPVSQVLKASRDLPVQAMEACLRCVHIIISRGWGNKIDLNLGGQLLDFLTLSCDTSGKTVPTPLATDELRTAGFRCLRALLEALKSTSAGRSYLVGTANVPSLAHAVSVIIEGITNGESFQMQLAATEALDTLASSIDDLEVLSSFLPGIVSSLTKVLTPNTQARRHWKVLVAALYIIETLLRSLLNNTFADRISTSATETKATNDLTKTTKLDGSWVKATASQLKLAIANINRLRTHERTEVQEAVMDFNLTLLSDCNHALQDSCSLALETLLLLVQSNDSYRDRFAAVVQSNPPMSSLLATVFHNEQLSLVRVMQSNDDQAKERSLGKLFGAYSILAETEVDMSIISKMLSGGLKDSVATILQTYTDRKIGASRVTPITITDLALAQQSPKSLTFASPLAEYKAQESFLNYMSQQLGALKARLPALGLASSLMPALRATDKTDQVAAFWLALQDLRQANDEIDSFMDDTLVGGIYSNNQSISLREQLYTISLDILETDEFTDWRLKTLALEAIALQASRQKADFQNELVEALYPILHHLGSESGYVR